MNKEKKAIYMWPSCWRKPVAHGDCGAISSNNIYATRAGLSILAKGGNAFDAAVAVSLTLSVVEPHHSGIGGGCFSLHYSAKNNEVIALDGRGIAPQKATSDLFIKDGEVQDDWKDLGGQSVVLPGLLRTLDTILKNYGTMSLEQVCEPAITCALEGFGTSYTGSLTMYDDSVERKLKLSEPFRRLYLKRDGSFYKFGEVQKNPELGTLLKKIATTGVDYFYTGDIAKKMVDVINERGGCFTLQDLEKYEPKIRTTVKTSYHNYDIVSFGPPSGGCAVIEMLNILENKDIRKTGHNTAKTLHTLAEAMKLGFSDRSVALADPDFVEIDTDYLTSKEFAAQRAALITDSANEYKSAESITPKEYPGNTSHFVVMDKYGNAFSQTQTVRDWFGSGIVVDGFGFVLNNAMSDFSAAVGALTSQGLTYGMANAIEGGKTPLSSMSPTLAFKDGKPILAIGAAGGPRIITGIVQGIVNAIDYHMSPETLVNMPYVNCLTKAQGLEVECGISEDTLDLLRNMGHSIVKVPIDQAMSTMLNSVMRIDNEYFAAGTKRVDGCGGALTSSNHIILEGICQEDI